MLVREMIAENYVVKGSFFSYRQKDEELSVFFQKTKNKITDYFHYQAYVDSSPGSIFSSYAEMQFKILIENEIPQKGLLSKFRKKEEEPYFKKLRITRRGTPWIVKLNFYPGKFLDADGLNIDIISEPAIFYQIDQLGWNIPIDRKEYSFITYSNTQFIIGLANAMLWSTIKDPKPLQYYSKTELSQKMRKYNFEKIADLLEKGTTKIEIGNSDDGLMDLRSAIEIFLVDLIKRIGESPHPQDKVSANIEILEKLGYLDGKMKGLIIQTLYNGVWSKISDTAVHKREPFNLFDARLCFNVTEEIFDYFIEKVLRYNIKTSTTERK
jgi:hypothetical protein